MSKTRQVIYYEKHRETVLNKVKEWQKHNLFRITKALQADLALIAEHSNTTTYKETILWLIEQATAQARLIKCKNKSSPFSK